MKDSYIDLISASFKKKCTLYVGLMKISLLTGVVRCPIVKGDTENMSQKLRQRYHLAQKVLRGKISLNDAEGRGFSKGPQSL